MEQGDEALVRQQVLLGQISAAGLLLTVSSLFYARVFAGPGWIAPVLASVLLSGLMAVLLARTGLGRWFRTIALVAAGFIFVLLTVLLPGTSFGDFAEIGDVLVGATVDGWRNSLAATLPISTAIPEPLGFITIVGWAVGATTGVLLMRSEKSASPVIPSVLFALLSLPLAAPGGAAGYLLIAALLAAALLLALVRAVPQSQLTGDARERVTEFVGERMLSERLISGAPALLLLALVVPLIALFLPGLREEPFDPRTLREEEVVTANAVNPLAELKAQRDNAVPAFELTLPAPPSPSLFDRVGLVPLDIYDGATWNSDATYAATSTEVDLPFEPTVETLTVRQEITILDSPTPWLPAGQPVQRIEADDIWFDEETGSLLERSNRAGRTFAIVSQISAPLDEELNEAVVDRTNPRFLELPAPIASDSPIAALTAEIEGTTDFERLTSLENILRDEFTFVVDEASGTALGRLEEFIADQEGYRDQFVSTFAVAARQQGFPSRIVVGYRIALEAEDNSLVFLDTVTSEQYDAWPEVLFDGIGWVAFDPVPATSGEAGANTEDATEIEEGQPAQQGPTPEESNPEEDDQVDDQGQPASATVRLLVVSGLFLVLFPIMLFLVVLLAKMIRRRYRRNLPDPTDRVLAGWQESKDRLLESGVDITPDMTVKEIVSTSRRELGVHASSSLAALAPFVTTTIYSNNAPTPAAADAVWHELGQFDEQLNDGRSRFQTFKARADPRPLLEKV